MNVGEARRIAGTLSFPSKMPGTSYSLPAAACVTGAKLAKLPGTSCHACYALKGGGSYSRANAAKGMQRRLASISNPLWINAMVTLLLWTHAKPFIKVDLGWKGVRQQRTGGERYQYGETGHHRWHDSGDIQSVAHLIAINEVAHRTPNIKHWLPTQELGMVNKFISEGWKIAPNLVIRVSSVMVENGHFNAIRRSWPHTSSVFTMRRNDDAHICPAPTQGHRCGSCRACWSPGVPHVAYLKH